MDIDLNEIRRYALINAIEHGGKAQPKSVLGKFLAEHPELRSRVLEIRSNIEKIVEDVNRISLEKQRAELGTIPEKVKIEEKKGLPDLDRGRDTFTMRFAPNPDGALHLGNARPAVLCDEYCKKYKGRMILRFDDTDPKIKIPEKKFYKWIKEDLKWLKVSWSKEIIASKRLPLYYSYAEKLVKMGAAYVCTCNSDTWKKIRDNSKSCSCRSIDSRTQMRRWKKMLSHSYKEGQAVLRIKTDLEAKNPAVRDWPAFRIVDKPKHPFSKKKIWPLYNFASAIDDHLLEVTHIMRGQEHSTNETKQRFVYEYFRWEYPEVITLGRFSLSDMVLSKSTIRDGITKGNFVGWDDPRLGTLRTLKRRGFQPEAIRNIIVEVGPKPSDITISLENLSAYNRRIIDKSANRYFFLSNPKKIDVKGLSLKKVRIPLHPDKKNGFRNFSLSKSFYIEKSDFDMYKGIEVRLKDLCNVKLGEVSEYTSSELKAIPKIHWLPAKYIQVKIIMPDKETKGYGEVSLSKAKIGEIVQFERFGFVCIEKSGKGVVVIFSHK